MLYATLVPRVLLVDDSASVRTLIAQKLRVRGYEVEEYPDGTSAAERALQNPPSVVVTDLLMPGMSGVQLCRLLHAEPATANVPVILLTAAGDRRSRFWARSAGAVAYVSKTEVDALAEVLPEVLKASVTSPPVSGAVTSRGMVQERLSQLLDRALFESVIAGEVRALASLGDATRAFSELCGLVSEVIGYRWLGLATSEPGAPLMLHAHPLRRETCEMDARAALGAENDQPFFVVADNRAMEGDGPAPFVVPIFFATTKVGEIAFGPTMRGFGREDKKLGALVAHELAGPLRMAALMEETKRLAAVDAVTGLLNRRAFLDAMTRERSRADRHNHPIAMLMVDVNHFKAVNDSRGHAAGDAVLQGVGRILSEMARKSNLAGRWGGEEFVLALPRPPKPAAASPPSACAGRSPIRPSRRPTAAR